MGLPMNLPNFAGVFEEPTTEIEKFLTEPLDTPEYVNHFALVYGRICTTIAQLSSNLSVLKLEKALWEAKAQKKICSRTDPHTKKPYTMAAAERILSSERVAVDFRRREIEMIRRISILKAYEKALELKGSLMPGEQGRLNRLMSANFRGG